MPAPPQDHLPRRAIVMGGRDGTPSNLATTEVLTVAGWEGVSVLMAIWTHNMMYERLSDSSYHAFIYRKALKGPIISAPAMIWTGFRGYIIHRDPSQKFRHEKAGTKSVDVYLRRPSEWKKQGSRMSGGEVTMFEACVRTWCLLLATIPCGRCSSKFL